MNNQYTHPIQRGQAPEKFLPPGTALVLEGGGIRGFYSSGVFEAFMDKGIMFPYIIGVSAGAANALTYVSGQKLRSRLIVEHYVKNKKYVSKRNLLLHGSMFGYDFIFKAVPNRHVFFDNARFNDTNITFLTGVTDCITGETLWYGKESIDRDLTVSRASCSLPLLSPMVKFDGKRLLDGGTSCPIPIEKSIADGNNFHVIVLTRNVGYQKEPFNHKTLLKLKYGKYPKLCEVMLNRHETYNRQLALCEQLERDGKAVIIRPLLPLEAGRTSGSTEALLKLYDEGHREGAEALTRILAHVEL